MIEQTAGWEKLYRMIEGNTEFIYWKTMFLIVSLSLNDPETNPIDVLEHLEREGSIVTQANGEGLWYKKSVPKILH